MFHAIVTINLPAVASSTGRRVIVNQRVASALEHPQSLGRISPMDHCVEAMLFTLFDLG
jgi:hypothetical protein